ncbi:hypothetical protein JYT31_01005 [Beggiatoa alba]|nr:hypothetical protein [Beggiatoa alba]
MMSNITKSVLKLSIFVSLSALILTGCSTLQSIQLANKCNSGLYTANTELNNAKRSGINSRVSWSKAASLLTAAKMQQQFEKYPKCINKVARARYYIGRSQTN